MSKFKKTLITLAFALLMPGERRAAQKAYV
jgi:hypothetical protein